MYKVFSCDFGNTIRYAGVRIGPVVRKDVMRASTMLEHEEKYACILAFDVKVGDHDDHESMMTDYDDDYDDNHDGDKEKHAFIFAF